MSVLLHNPGFAGIFSLATYFAAFPAHAAAVSFVSASGANTGDCSTPAAPCRTLQFALTKTLGGGEIKIMDPGSYNAVTINKAITITGVEGAGIFFGAGDLITISAAATDAVALTGLTIDGFNRNGVNGLVVNSVGNLTIKNCVFRNLSSAAINIVPTTSSLKFLIEDTVVSNNGNEAIRIRAPGLSAVGTLNRVSSVNNGFAGMRIFNGANVNVADSVFSGNQSDNILVGAAVGSEVGGELSVSRSTFLGGGTGIRVLTGSVLRIESSSITGNNTGVNLSAGVNALSAGNNFIRGNTTDVAGAGSILTASGQR